MAAIGAVEAAKTATTFRNLKWCCKNFHGAKGKVKQNGKKIPKINKIMDAFKRSKFNALMGQEHKLAESGKEDLIALADVKGLTLYINYDTDLNAKGEQGGRGGTLILIKHSTPGLTSTRGGGGLEGRLTWANLEIDGNTVKLRTIYA